MRPGNHRLLAGMDWRGTIVAFCFILLGLAAPPCARGGSPTAPDQAGLVLTVEGVVEINRAGTEKWIAARTNLSLSYGDSLRTGPRSRATVRLSDLSVLRVNEKTVLEIRPQSGKKGSSLDLRTGSTYFFNRSKPSSLQFHTPLISGAIRGTEFNLEAVPDGPTTVTLLEGEVALNNSLGDLVLQSGEQGIVEPGKAPRKTAVLNAINVIQWSLYYPAVLDPDELDLSAGARDALGESLAAYRSGDLLAALEKIPLSHRPASDSERLYYAALYLAWMVLPRAIGFSFYYLPAATVASLALAYCFFRGETKRWLWGRWIFLAAALAGFVLFLPLSAASIETSLAGYERLMWIASWR